MEIHILNGDALKAQFPTTIPGKLIVMRACLVDGDPKSAELEDLFRERADFLHRAYGVPLAEYRQQTIPEIEKIRQLPKDAVVNLWFEEDLFCQVNFWFTAFLIQAYTEVSDSYLVSPTTELQYGFGGMDQEALGLAYTQRSKIDRVALSRLAQLWRHYLAGEHDAMSVIAEEQKKVFPFLPAAVQANRDRYPDRGTPGRPKQALKAIIAKIGVDHFGPVFQAFNQQESIYGYGDLQVKRLFDEVKNEA